MRAERRLVSASGSYRHIDFLVRVADQPAVRATRPPLAISLVLDRSGSMHGDKIETARRAALAVLDRLEASDRVAAVIFDDRIHVLQTGAPATREVKGATARRVERGRRAGSTALHEGWLTGCRAIAAEGADSAVARCFLLTDGLANVGLQDAEQIASDAASIREHAGVGTSTFGIGADYDEGLLGPMAVAGGGQFHNLRSPDEIARTFLGELGELLTVAAANVRLEIQATPSTTAEIVSTYWIGSQQADAWTIALGDLLAGEERHVVVRFRFGAHATDTAAGARTSALDLRGRRSWVAGTGQPR
jgi:Ca-activated chloride channel family protein